MVVPATAAKPKVAYVVSSLRTASACKKVAGPAAGEEGDFATFRCPGTAGYRLILGYDDSRENLTVVAPGGKQSDLELWTRVGSTFSSLGESVEWRVVGGTPVALTVRYVLSGSDDSGTSTSWLVVVKITAARTCVTTMVPPGPEQNAKARALAATATTKPCLPAL